MDGRREKWKAGKKAKKTGETWGEMTATISQEAKQSNRSQSVKLLWGTNMTRAYTYMTRTEYLYEGIMMLDVGCWMFLISYDSCSLAIKHHCPWHLRPLLERAESQTAQGMRKCV